MGDGGSAHEVGTFSSRADDLHIGEIMQVEYSGDYAGYMEYQYP